MNQDKEKKARELTRRFSSIYNIDWSDAKQCALIAVDFLLKEGRLDESSVAHPLLQPEENINYWNDIREIIQKL